jgi:hypothetical protein
MVTVKNILAEIAQHGIRVTVRDDGRLQFTPRIGADLLSKLRQCPYRDVIRALQEPEPQDWWDLMTPEDIRYAHARLDQTPCPWCRRRGGKHFQNCVTHEWHPTMPLGKYKGERLDAIPERYLTWLLDSSVRLTDELRQSIQDTLGLSERID